MNTKRLIIIILIVAVVAFASYKLLQKVGREEETNGVAKPTDDGGGGTSSTTSRNDNFPLKKGSKGERVKVVQKFCNWAKDCGLTVDGDFGSRTEAAVKKCVSVDGVEANYVSETAYNTMNTILAKYKTRADYIASQSPKQATTPTIPTSQQAQADFVNSYTDTGMHSII